MKSFNVLIWVGLLVLFVSSYCQQEGVHIPIKEDKMVQYVVDPKVQDLRLFWQDDEGEPMKGFKRLSNWLEGRGEELVFAMNGGMFLKDYSPQGLYVEEGVMRKTTDTIQSAYGNFYLQPNGIFFLTHDGKGGVLATKDFEYGQHIRFATQSGPMLVIDGALHHKFIKGSSSLHIRNGVGILPDGKVLFAMSKEKVNFYDFASFFKYKGCQNALYLDGFVSRTYLPAQKWTQMDGRFGVMIGEVKNKQ